MTASHGQETMDERNDEAGVFSARPLERTRITWNLRS